ncbi:MAG: CHASE3 domain-containing protein [Acidimicrobiia bacterium]|nr:CHASE3 domain-containing protein [Acidimicrobiia bacterium]
MTLPQHSADRPPSLRQQVRSLLIVTFVLTGTIALLVAVSFVRLLDSRATVLGELDPVALESSALLASFLDQRAGLRGYVLSDGDEIYLDHYVDGVAAAELITAEIDRLTADHRDLTNEVDRIGSTISAWASEYAEPTLAGGLNEARDAELAGGRDLFADVRLSFDEFQEALDELRSEAIRDLNRATIALLVAIVALATMSITATLVLWRTYHSAVARPLNELGEDATAVADGDLDRSIRRPRHAELIELSEAMEDMRGRLVEELHVLEDTHQALEEQAAELGRSNSDLEQFAYVASHDLQEPLRKVISFSQLLQSRYGDQLDERADQYIEYAVDGARRMQVLINDLLAFSRVGRFTGDHVAVDLGEVVDQAVQNLDLAITDADATVAHEGLPTVDGDPTLLVSMFQNLIANAVKFRREGVAPHVRASARHDDGRWVVDIDDNGIGIEPEFDERVFVIFQRLHGKDVYGGTGIGLAMCRKIAEHHGGTIHIEPTDGPGTRFRIELPDPAGSTQ